MLRQPLTDPSEWKARRAIIEYFRSEEKVRVDYQLALSQIGFTRKYAMIDYVNTISGVVPESNVGNYLQLLLYPVCILLIVIQPATGVLALIAALIYNIYTYFKTKSSIEPYFVTVGAIAHLISCANDILKLPGDSPILEPARAKMREAVKTLGTVVRGSKFLGTASAAGADMGSAVGDYVNMFLRLDLIKFNRLIAHMQKHKREILSLMEETGALDACISMASYEEMLPFCCEADLEEMPAAAEGSGAKRTSAEAKQAGDPTGSDGKPGSTGSTGRTAGSGEASRPGKPHLYTKNMYHVLLAEPVTIRVNCGTAAVITEDGKDYPLYVTYLQKDNSASFNQSGIHVTSRTEEGETVYTYTLTVANNPGVELPNTGGVGTGMFTLFGCILMMGGALLLLVRYRAKMAF